jgi:hypothetical protein
MESGLLQMLANKQRKQPCKKGNIAQREHGLACFVAKLRKTEWRLNSAMAKKWTWCSAQAREKQRHVLIDTA